MRRTLPSLLAAVLAFPALAAAQPRQWVVSVDLWGNPAYQTLTLQREGEAVSGSLGGDPVTGTWRGDSLRFTVTSARQGTCTFEAQAGPGGLAGTADLPDTNDPKARARHAFKARPIPERPAGPPVRHEVHPDRYANVFSPHLEPVLTVWPGDTVATTTLDSGGMDAQGVTRALFGNPQTGPFFVATAEPGDTLAVHLRRLRLNRDHADSLDGIVGRAQHAGLAVKAQGLGRPVRWRLDRALGVARLESPSDALKGFTVPLRPMLGGLAVAPGFGSAPMSTGDTGRFGGNMDFNAVVEGNTVYLPVFQPGALLYLGDGHALQGDGETSQYALETSMEVEFSVDVLKGWSIGMPRVESPTQIMVLGQAGSLDDALRSATGELIQWLAQDYGLGVAEATEVLGTSVQYTVANLAGRSVGLAAKLDKDCLAGLKRRAPGGTR